MARRVKDGICPDCWRPEHKGKCETTAEYTSRIREADAAQSVARLIAESQQDKRDRS